MRLISLTLGKAETYSIGLQSESMVCAAQALSNVGASAQHTDLSPLRQPCGLPWQRWPGPGRRKILAHVTLCTLIRVMIRVMLRAFFLAFIKIRSENWLEQVLVGTPLFLARLVPSVLWAPRTRP